MAAMLKNANFQKPLIIFLDHLLKPPSFKFGPLTRVISIVNANCVLPCARRSTAAVLKNANFRKPLRQAVDHPNKTPRLKFQPPGTVKPIVT